MSAIRPDGPGGGVFSEYFWLEPNHLDIENTIIYNNQAFLGPQIRLEDCITDIAYSNIEGGPEQIESLSTDIIHYGPGNIDVDPCFFDPDNGDFRLLLESLCINAGDPNFKTKSGFYDLAGLPRVAFGRLDMGAFEFNADEVAAYIYPKHVRINNPFWKYVVGIVLLPDTHVSDILDEPLVLMPGHTESDRQRYHEFTYFGRPFTAVIAYFEKSQLVDRTAKKGGKIQINLFGRYRDGGYYYGTGDLRLVKNGKKTK